MCRSSVLNAGQGHGFETNYSAALSVPILENGSTYGTPEKEINRTFSATLTRWSTLEQEVRLR